MKALIFENNIMSVSEEAFEVHPSMEWIDVPNDCKPDWTYSNGTVSPYVEPADTRTYAELRAEAYPSLTEQADMAYWDRQNGTTTLDDAISAVKAEFPKG